MKNFNISCLNYFLVPDSCSVHKENEWKKQLLYFNTQDTVLGGRFDFSEVQMEPPLSSEVSFQKINIVSSN